MNVSGSTLLTAGALGAAAVGVGIGAGAVTMPWIRESRESKHEDRYEAMRDWIADSAAAKDGTVIYPFPTSYADEAEGYAQAGAVVIPGMAALAAAGFGVAQLFKSGATSPSKLLGAAGVLAGGAVLGAVVGGIRGNGQGERVVHERNGIAVADQVDELLQSFDRNRDGELDITESPSTVPEFERRNVTRYGVSLLSIQEDAVAADTNGNGRVTKDELRARLDTIDADGDGAITYPEARDAGYGDYGDKNRLLLSSIG